MEFTLIQNIKYYLGRFLWSLFRNLNALSVIATVLVGLVSPLYFFDSIFLDQAIWGWLAETEQIIVVKFLFVLSILAASMKLLCTDISDRRDFYDEFNVILGCIWFVLKILALALFATVISQIIK